MASKERKTSEGYRYNQKFLLARDAAGNETLQEYVHKNKAGKGRAAAAEPVELRPMRMYNTIESFDVINRIHKSQEHGKVATLYVRFPHVNLSLSLCSK